MHLELLREARYNIKPGTTSMRKNLPKEARLNRKTRKKAPRAHAATRFRSSLESPSESPPTVQAFPLANKPLYDAIPELVKIDKTAAFVASSRLLTQQVLNRLPLFNRFSFPLEYL
jgi:hypothetical protein